jgi:hypothetical protein
MTLCAFDIDWYAIELARGDRLQVIVNTDFLSSDHFQTVLFDPSGTDLLQEDSLIIDHTVPSSDVYLLRIQTTDLRASYDLLVTIARGIPCDDDDQEPNDTAFSAVPILPGSYTDLAVCPHDEDWFVIDKPNDQRLEVSIQYPAQEGDLDLDLLASDTQTLVMRSATAGNMEMVFVFEHPGTRFYIRVYGSFQTANSYEMYVTLTAISN